jgi:hypothetical protein
MAVMHAICAPGEEARLHRPGVTALVIGPSRVGKTTLVQQLACQLRCRAQPRMRRDLGHIPVVRFTATGAASGRYDWVDYYKAVLRQLADPFVDRRAASVRTRDLREATEEALIHRQPSAVIIDEAHHLAKANTGCRLSGSARPSQVSGESHRRASRAGGDVRDAPVSHGGRPVGLSEPGCAFPALRRDGAAGPARLSQCAVGPAATTPGRGRAALDGAALAAALRAQHRLHRPAQTPPESGA